MKDAFLPPAGEVNSAAKGCAAAWRPLLGRRGKAPLTAWFLRIFKSKSSQLILRN